VADPSIKDLAYRALAATLGGPVDVTTMFMRPFGYSTPPEQVVGGSEWMGQKLQDTGVISEARNPTQEFISSLMIPTPSGAGAAAVKGAGFIPELMGFGALGMFGGRKALTANEEALKSFGAMRQAGEPASKTWQETGWMMGPEGKAKFEINDAGAVVNPLALSPESVGKTFNASDILGHPEAYKAYPQLADIPVKITPQDSNSIGAFIPSTNTIEIDPKVFDPNDPFFDPEKAKSILLHEMQHVVQRVENFEAGGNPRIAQSILQAQKKADLGSFDPMLSYKWESAIADLTTASKADSIKSLDKIIKAENIKPSSIRNTTDWYKYSTDIVNQLGVAPTKSGKLRDRYYQQAASYMKDKLAESAGNRYYDNLSEKDIKNTIRSSKKELEKIRDDYFKFKEKNAKYNEMGKLPNESLYKRIAGESEARLVEKRMNMTDAERAQNFPLQQMDVPYDELLYRSLIDK